MLSTERHQFMLRKILIWQGDKLQKIYDKCKARMKRSGNNLFTFCLYADEGEGE